MTTAWRWWIDGLVDAVLLVRRRLDRRRCLRLVAEEGGYAIVRPDGRRLRRRLVTTRTGDEVRFEPDRLARRLAGRAVEVVVPDGRCVAMRLGPLPAESRAFLGEVIDHRLARVVPWPRADVVRVHRVEPVGEGDPRLMVAVEATSRAALLPVVAGLRRVGATRVEAVRLDAAGTVAAVFPLAAETERRRGVERRIVFALAAVVVLAGLAAHRSIDAIGESEARLEEIDGRIADYRRRLGPAGGGETQALATLARRTPLAVLTLEALSEALPDDTRLTDLTIARERASLQGITRDAAGLSRRLEGSKVFAPPVFTAASVTEADGTRFGLDLEIRRTAEERR